MLKLNTKKIFIYLILSLIVCILPKISFAQESPSVLYVPLIGITSVPQPLSLPKGSGNVTYHYAVKNFLSEVALTNIEVIDDNCSNIKFIEGDDNANSKLDYHETWRYICTIKLSKTTKSSATVKGMANSITATHTAYTTVIVGSSNPAPLVSIINATKITYPLSLPGEGQQITFTYKVNNPGVVPLEKVTVNNNSCGEMSNRLGDTNNNDLLDTNEVWIYTCTASLTQTTKSIAKVTAYANGLTAVGESIIAINMDTPTTDSPPLFDLSISSVMQNNDLKITIWKILSAILMVLFIYLILTHKRSFTKTAKKIKIF